MKVSMKSLLGIAVMGAVVAAIAQTTFPLRVTIDVNPIRSRQQIGAGAAGSAVIENVQVNVSIRQKGGALYTDPLHAELYVIGRQIQTGYYGIIDVIKEDFTFTKEQDRTFEFSSKNYRLGVTDGNINVGAVYETFLVVLVDSNGETIDTRSGRSIGEKGVALIREMGPLTLFDRDGNVVGKVENPGEAFRAAAPAAVAPGR
jgi:hypothetical protein